MKGVALKRIITIFLIASTLFIQAAEPPEKKGKRKLQEQLSELSIAKPQKRIKINEMSKPTELEDLPDEILLYIFQKTPDDDLLNCARTSTRFRNVAWDAFKNRLPDLSEENLIKLDTIYKQQEQQVAIKSEKKKREQKDQFETWMEGTSLSADNKNIGFIYPGVLQGLGNLEKLGLSKNQLQQLEPGTFQELGNLEELGIYDNQLEQLAPGAFKGLGNLKILDLSDNKLEQLAPGAFQGLGNLKMLFLDNNHLQQLAPGAFKGLDKLEELNLKNNKLQQLDPKAFKKLNNLKYLNLTGNPLSPDNVEDLRKQLPNVKIKF